MVRGEVCIQRVTVTPRGCVSYAARRQKILCRQAVLGLLSLALLRLFSSPVLSTVVDTSTKE